MTGRKNDRIIHTGYMNIDGRDLMKLGYRGPEIGRKLEELLGRIMDGTLENEREALLRAAEKEK